MFENLGISEIALIVIVFIVFFGPKKIPEVMNGIGRGVREFRKAMNDVQGEITNLTRVPSDDRMIWKPDPQPHDRQSAMSEPSALEKLLNTAETPQPEQPSSTAEAAPHPKQSSTTE